MSSVLSSGPARRPADRGQGRLQPGDQRRRGLDEVAIGEWCRQLAALTRDGREVIMVSSGAVAEGMKRLGWTVRPHEINELQAAAAVGQMGLAQMYETKLREKMAWARRRCC
jgi:glutamate 5-kinase